MRRNARFWIAAALGALLPAAPSLAHHPIDAKFDSRETMSLEGRVTHVDWADPHVHLALSVEDAGQVTRWFVELESKRLLEHNGWSADTLKPGDAVRVEGHPPRGNTLQIWGTKVELADSGEAVLALHDPSLLPEDDGSSEETPRWPDGQPRLGAEPGEQGYWVPTVTVLREDGVDVAMGPHGLLENLADAAEVAPLQAWALKLYEFRQRNHLRFDPSFVGCRPPAGPRKYQEALGFQFLEDRPLERIFVIPGGGNHDWHLIYTDGRALDGGFQLDDGNFLYYGRQVGEWEGDTFVIRSEGYNEKFWLAGGIPHTELMRLTERFTRPNHDTLEYQVSFEDPGAFTRPWTASWTMKWVEGEMPEYYCQDNRL